MTITFDSLKVNYGDAIILDKINGELAPGVTALLGANGSGKSTLIKVLGTLLKPTGGSVTINGHALQSGRSVQQARRTIGYLDQRTTFQSNYTVLESLTYSAWLHQIPRARTARATEVAIERTNLGPLLSQKIGELSGGMRQRAYIAQAIIHAPSTLLLDEPCTGLDMVQRHDLLQTISDLGATTTVLMATHGIEEMRGVVKDVLILQKGRVSFHGALQALATSGERNESSLAEVVRDFSR